MKLLTTKLIDRKKTYDIPGLPYLPKGKFCLVFRLPSETKTAGGLVLPDTAQDVKHACVLLAAGLDAIDELQDALIEIGDIVWVARFAGWEHEVKRDAQAKGQQMLACEAKEIIGSVDALDRVYGKTATHELSWDEETEKHWYVEKETTNA